MTHEGTTLDYYVRIPTTALAGVQLRHLVSERDSSIAVPAGMPESVAITGITEWVGSWCDQIVSVGWDWAVVDGIVLLLSQNEIRTNIQLVTQDESPVSAAIAQIHLFHWIESILWREAAVGDLFPTLENNQKKIHRS